jgi:uncharacterized membrane protein YphA (DoxX/SURF4 family)
MTRRLSAWQPWLSTAARLFLAYIFVSAGWPKLLDPVGTVRSVRGFQLLPEALVPAFGYALPVVELLIAALLVAGLFTRVAAVLTGGMMVMFLFGIISAWARGLSIECGCFGSSGSLVTDPVPGYIQDIVRDTVFLLVAAGLFWWPRSRFSADQALGLVPAADARPAAARSGR